MGYYGERTQSQPAVGWRDHEITTNLAEIVINLAFATKRLVVVGPCTRNCPKRRGIPCRVHRLFFFFRIVACAAKYVCTISMTVLYAKIPSPGAGLNESVFPPNFICLFFFLVEIFEKNRKWPSAIFASSVPKPYLNFSNFSNFSNFADTISACCQEKGRKEKREKKAGKTSCSERPLANMTL